nr:enoyl-CoA hydratase/isomerase family protein [Sphingomonas profundi]
MVELTFTRPDLHNRFDVIAHEEFVAALRHVARIEHARVLIVAAEGRSFSAGGDFEEMLEAHRSAAIRAQMTRDARNVLNGLIELPIPVISAVQGAAIGLGATIATMADIVVAWRHAKIADTHVAVGLVAGDGGVIAWSQSIGLNRAKRYLLSGDVITGEQAYDFGLVTELLDSAEAVLPAARALAQRIGALPAGGVNGTKKAFAAITRARMGEAFELGIALEMDSMASPDLAETVARLRKR